MKIGKNRLCRLSTDFHFDIRLHVQGIGARSGDCDLDAVFAMIVDEGDGLAGQLYAVNGQ
jgi:hypothetical protein